MNIKKILSVGSSLALILGLVISFSNVPIVKADTVYNTPPEASPYTINSSATGVNVLEAFIKTPGVTFADPGFANLDSGWNATTINPTYAAEYGTLSSNTAENLNIANSSSSVVVNFYVFTGCTTQPASACPSTDLTDAYQVTYSNGAYQGFTANLSAATLASENTATPANLTLTVPASATITQSTLVPETNGVPTSNAAVTTAIAHITPIAVTLANTGGTASANVRISPIGAGSNIQLWAQDSNSNWYDINVTGWGPAGGFSVPANSGSITTNVYPISSVAGSYTLTANLVDAATPSTLVTSGTGKLVVNVAPAATFSITPPATQAYTGTPTSFGVGISGATLPSDTSDQITLTFKVTNASGAPVVGQSFALSSIAGQDISGLGTLASSTDSNGTISVTGSLNDLASMFGVTVSQLIAELNGGTAAAATVSTTFTNPGTYTLLLTASDAHGTIASTTGTVVVKTAPSATFTITPSSTPAYAGVQTSFNVGVSGVTLPSDTSDQITLSFRVTNASGTPVSGQTFSLSSIAGVSASELSGLGVTLATSTDVNGTISVTGSINDLAQMLDTSTSTLTEYVPNAIGTISTTFAKAGTYTLSLTASDVNGTIASTTAKVIVTVPAGPSVPTLLSPVNDDITPTNVFTFRWNPSTASVAGPITYEFHSSMNSAEVGGVLTTGLWDSGTLTTSSLLSSGAPNGAWYWQVRAKDAAGNVSAWSTIWAVKLNTIPPPALATCATGTSPVFVETDTVNSNSYTSTVGSSTLTSGQTYLLVASGTWQNGGINAADAAYASVDNWATYMQGYNIAPNYLGSGEFQLRVGGSFVNWGAYQPTHKYSYLYTGTGNPISLMVFDGNSTVASATPNTAWYGDNSGNLVVNVYSCHSNTPPPVTYVTTDAATNMTPTDATLNGVNGADTATGHSFWVSTSTFSTASPNIPSGVYSTPNFGSINASTTFSASLSSIITTGIPANLPAVTPNTKYYYAAWSLVNGTWHPGAVMSFTTPAKYVTTDATTGVTSMSATLNGTNGSSAANSTSFWWGTTPITGTLTAGVNPGSSSEFPSTGWNHDNGLRSALAGGSFSEPLTNLTPSTTYYYVAWSYVGGTWYPGAVMSFTTNHAPYVTTDAATSVATSSAMVNGTNGPSAADDTSFWLGMTSSTPFVSSTNPGSELPSGWSGVDSLTQPTSGLFSHLYTGLTPSTTYYYVAWSQVGGTWYPGDVMTFQTLALGADDTLSALGVSAGSLSPSFGSATTSYTDLLPYNTSAVPTVTATTTDPNATEVITQAANATGTATVAVTAQNGATQDYTVAFSLASPTTTVLKVIVNVDNSRGGSATPSDFTVHVIAANPSPTSTFPGSAAGTETTINANAPYYLNISSLANYDGSYTELVSGACGGNSGIAGDFASCTITETFHPYNLFESGSSDYQVGKVLGASITGNEFLQQQIATLQAQLIALLQQYLTLLHSRMGH